MLRTILVPATRGVVWSMLASALASCGIVAPPCRNCTDGAGDAGMSSDAARGTAEWTSEVTTGTSGDHPIGSSEAVAVTDATDGSVATPDDTSGSNREPNTSTIVGSTSDVGTSDDSTTSETGPKTTGADGSTDPTGTSETSSAGDTSATDVSATDTSAARTSGPGDTEPGNTGAEEPMHEVLWNEGFENGLGGWTVEGTTWTVGSVSNGSAPSPRGGSGFVGTGLAGPYVRENSRLLTPGFIVPAANPQPYLRYWYWYSLEAADTVQLQVRVGAEENWTDLQAVTDTISTVGGHGNRWKQALLTLDQFAGQEIQLSFALRSTGGTTVVPGFFVDNVSLETGPMNVCSCQGFNNGQVGDWSIEGGQWAIGAPEYAAAPDPHDNPEDLEDQNNNPGLAGTNMARSYESLASAPVARLTSPSYQVDNAWRIARFYFWHSLANAGSVTIQVRTLGERWQDVAGFEFTGASASTLTYRELPLGRWEGETIQVGFLLENGGGVEVPTTPGFFFDEFSFQ